MIKEEYSKWISLLKNEINRIKIENIVVGLLVVAAFSTMLYIGNVFYFYLFLASPFIIIIFAFLRMRKELVFVSEDKSKKFELYKNCEKMAKVFNCMAELNPSCDTGYAIFKYYSNKQFMFEDIVDRNYAYYGKAELILLAMSQTKADVSELDSFAKLDVKDRLKLLDGLFCLAIAEDGIKLDEWQFLLSAIKRLKLNKFYTEDYIKRFSPLRTEWTDEEQEALRKENERREQQRRAYRESESSDSHQPLLHQYYVELGLNDNASYEEVRKAYHALAMQHHPDLPKNADRQQECQDLMVKINLAYSKIMDR